MCVSKCDFLFLKVNSAVCVLALAGQDAFRGRVCPAAAAAAGGLLVR